MKKEKKTITEKRATIHLRKLEKKLEYYKQVVKNSNDAVIIQDFNGIVKAWNGAAKKIYGFSEKEMLGKNIIRIISKKERAMAKKNILAIKKGNPVFRVQQTRKTKSGKEIFVNITYAPIYEKEEIIEIATTEENISKIKKSLAEHDLLLNNMSEAVVAYEFKNHNRDIVIKDMNRAAEKLEKIKKEDVIGKRVDKVFKGVKKFGLYDVLRKVWKTGKPINHPISFYRDSYHMGWRENYVFKLDGYGVVAIYTDVTEKKQQEWELIESREKYRTLFEPSKDAIMTLEPPSWNFTSGNKAMVKMFKAKNERDFISKQPWQVSPKYQPDGQLSSVKAKKMIQKAMKDGKNFFEWTHKKLGGEEFYTTVLLSRVDEKDKSYLQATVRNINSEKKAGEKLRESEEQHRTLIENTLDYIYLIDSNYRVLSVNGSARKLLGGKTKNIVGKRLEELFPKKIAEGYKKSLKKVFSTGRPISIASSKMIVGDKTSWISVTLSPIKDINRRVVSIIGVAHDITLKKKAEDKLKENEKKLQSIFDHSAVGISMTGLDGKWIEANPALCKITGYSKKELLSKAYLQLTFPPDIEKTKEFTNGFLSGKKHHGFIEKRYITKDGRIVWVYLSVVLVKDRDNKPLYFVVHTEDITERKRLELELKKFLQAAENTNEAVILTDTKGIINYANISTDRMLGYSHEELLGLHVRKIVAKEKDAIKIFEEIISKGAWIGELDSIKKGGEIFISKLSASTIKDDDGNVMGTMGILRDIRHEKEIEKSKTEFVSLASHQLRTPLASINWIGEMFLHNDFGAISDKQRESMEMLHKSSIRMSALISSLLNVSRLELGTFNVTRKPVVMCKVVNDTLSELEPQIEAKKIRIIRKCSENMPTIKADPILLKIICQNIITNAVHYSRPKTAITIKSIRNRHCFLLTVKDHGIGIPKKEQGRVYAKFFRASNAQAMEASGTGLGLYIVKSILDAVGGEIWFESTLGKGTTFFIKLPLSGMKARKGIKSLEMI
jgi:PAS domain S-box-containing protein